MTFTGAMGAAKPTAGASISRPTALVLYLQVHTALSKVRGNL